MVSRSSKEFNVNYRYGLYFTKSVFSKKNVTLGNLLARDSDSTTVSILADSGLLEANPEIIDQAQSYISSCGHDLTNSFTVEGGERCKYGLEVYESILSHINRIGLCRHSYILAIGGGAVLDVAGFAASTAHRGIKLIRVPTTIMSQLDSGVGVKNGVNLFGKKNFVGTFSLPYAVINDVNLLSTLDERNWRAGFSEAVKVALIKDRAFFDYLLTNADGIIGKRSNIIETVIEKSARLHYEHITLGGDPFERSSLRPLDCGHWSAHKLESLSDFTILHGEAVAAGIAIDAVYSHLKGYLSQGHLLKLLSLFSALGLSVNPLELITYYDKESLAEALSSGLEEFREHMGGALSILMVSALGESFEVSSYDESKLPAVLDYLSQYSSAEVARSPAGKALC